MVAGIVVPALGTEVTESDGLFWWQIDDNKTIDTGLLGIFQQLLLAVAQHRIVVAHEQHRRLQALSPCISDHLQGRCDGDAILQRLCVCFLYGGAICDWIGEGKTKFDEIYQIRELLVLLQRFGGADQLHQLPSLT